MRQNSLSSIYNSSMESLSSSHGAESYWSIDQELAPTSTAYTIPRLRAKISDYDTGFSASELEEEKKQKKSGRVRKVRAKPSCGSGFIDYIAILPDSITTCM